MQFKPPIVQDMFNAISQSKRKVSEAFCIPKELLESSPHGHSSFKQYKFNKIRQQIIIKDIYYEEIYIKD